MHFATAPIVDFRFFACFIWAHLFKVKIIAKPMDLYIKLAVTFLYGCAVHRAITKTTFILLLADSILTLTSSNLQIHHVRAVVHWQVYEVG